MERTEEGVTHDKSRCYSRKDSGDFHYEKERISMFQRILVPLDGSQRTERALSVAARIARATMNQG